MVAQRSAVLFPGQGSQFRGMGRDLYDVFSAAREVFEEASDALQLDMRGLCFEAPEEILDRPSHTRPAVCTVSLAALRVLEHEVGALTPAYLAGHSLGEYTANIVAGVMPFQAVLKALRVVGRAMERIPGMMAALIGLERTQVIHLCQQAARAGLVTPAGFNAPGQVVISGTIPAVRAAMERARQEGAGVVPLRVGAPCHSPLMAPVEETLRGAFTAVTFAPARTPVVSNVGAEIHKGGLLARELLVRQLTTPVEWQGSIQALLDRGVSTFIEVGPGRVLTGLLARQARGMPAMAVSDLSSLSEAVSRLRGKVEPLSRSEYYPTQNYLMRQTGGRLWRAS